MKLADALAKDQASLLQKAALDAVGAPNVPASSATANALLEMFDSKRGTRALDHALRLVVIVAIIVLAIIWMLSTAGDVFLQRVGGILR